MKPLVDCDRLSNCSKLLRQHFAHIRAAGGKERSCARLGRTGLSVADMTSRISADAMLVAVDAGVMLVLWTGLEFAFASHVGVPGRKPHPYLGRNRNHRCRPLASAAIAAVTVALSTAPVIRTRAPLANSISIVPPLANPIGAGTDGFDSATTVAGTKPICCSAAPFCSTRTTAAIEAAMIARCRIAPSPRPGEAPANSQARS